MYQNSDGSECKYAKFCGDDITCCGRDMWVYFGEKQGHFKQEFTTFLETWVLS